MKHGFDVYACTSAADGIASIRHGFAPDVILFDITMPETSGYEFLENLRDVALPCDCLKLALTNEGQDAEISRTLKLGADAHIIKAGYTAHELVTLVREMIETRKGFKAPSVSAN